MTGAPEEPPRPVQVEPLGAPTDPLRPTGRVAEQAVAASKQRMAARAGRILRVLAIGMAAALLLALVSFVVIALWPKPDL